MQIPSLLYWVVTALLVFWAVGAYNRLVRLRADASQSFSVLEAELARQADLVRQCRSPDVAPGPEAAEFWAGLEGAAAQLRASLAQARARPLDPSRMAALAAAHDVLTMAWDRAERADAHDLAGHRLPENISQHRIDAGRSADAAAQQFDACVSRYNGAIAQFPALLLAWLFGFGVGRPFRPDVPLRGFPGVNQ